MRGRIFGFSGVRGASARWLWLALAAALVLVACGGGGGGGSGQTGTAPTPDTQFAPPPPPRPTAVLGFSADRTEINESGGWATLTLELNRPIPTDDPDLEFRYDIQTDRGSGLTLDDITASSFIGSITVAAGDDTGTTTLTAVDDLDDESNGETMTVLLYTDVLPENAAGDTLTVSSLIVPVRIIIKDDDGSTGIPPESVSEFRAESMEIDAVPGQIDEDGGVSILTLILNSQVPSGDPALIFPYIISGDNITAEDITAPDLTGFITVDPGSGTGTTTITGADDSATEGDEIMTIMLDADALPKNASGNLITAEGVGSGRIIIKDDDVSPDRVTGFRAMPEQIDENGGVSTLTLELNRAVPSGNDALPFRYVISGTNINTEDITASDLTGSITVEPGSSTGTTDITGLDDPAIEGDEIMAIRLDTLPDNASGNKITADGIGPVRITITDDDVAIQPDRVTGFSVAPARIDEGGGGATLTLELNRPIPDGNGNGDGDLALTFPYIISGDNITAADVAAPGLTGVMTVAAGESTGAATITALQDFAVEGDETMIVRLGVLPDNAGGIRLAADDIGPIEITILDAQVLPICSASLIGDPEPDAAPVTTGNIRQTITLSAGEAVVNAALDFFDYHVYRITLARAGRLVITPESTLDLEAVFFQAPVRSGEACPEPEDGYASDIDFDGGNFNFSFDGDLEAGPYYLVVNEYFGDPGDYLLRMTFTPRDDVGGNAPSDAAGEQARLTRQVRALALSTMAAQTGMLTDLVRRRGRATPAMDGVRFGSLPDEGGGRDLRNLLKSSLSLQHTYRLDSGGYASAWMSSTATSLAGDPASLHAGLEWASADRRAIHGLAISADSSSVAFPANVAGLENTGPHRSPNRQPNNQWPKQWPKQWNESMTLIAPYLTRRTDSADIWITAGIGGGEVRLDGSGGDATIMFLQAGAAWKKILPSGQRFDLEARGRAARKHVSGFRLNAHDIPGLSVDLFQLDGRASLLWPLALAGGIVRPGVKVDFSHDFSDILPGRDRQRLRSITAVSWTRGLFSAALESHQHSTDRGSPWRNLTARMKLDSGDGFTTTLDGLVGGRGVQFTLKGVF